MIQATVTPTAKNNCRSDKIEIKNKKIKKKVPRISRQEMCVGDVMGRQATGVIKVTPFSLQEEGKW